METGLRKDMHTLETGLRDDMHALDTRLTDGIARLDKRSVVFTAVILAAIFVTNPRVLDLFGRLWTVVK